MELYSQQDLQTNAAQLRRALWGLALPSVVFFAVLIYSLAVRVQWLTVLVTVLWGGLLIFLWAMKASPILAYRKQLKGVLTGLRRTAEGVVVSFSEDGTYKDGVFYSVLILNSDPKLDPKGERLFYVDRCKQRPPFEPGDFVRVTANGNFLIAWEK